LTEPLEIIAADIGNTSMTLCHMRGLDVLGTIDTSSRATLPEVVDAIASLKPLAALPLVCASVNPRGMAALEQAWRKLGGQTVFAFGRDGAAPITSQARGAGQDRLMNAIAARHRVGNDAIVVDFGTAITFDVLRGGAYAGGVIAPGIGLAMEALHQKTALLPLVEITQRKPEVVGTDTESAINAGVYYGYLGLVDNILTELLKTWETPPPVIATGGYGAHLAPAIPRINESVPELTHLGIALAWSESKRPA